MNILGFRKQVPLDGNTLQGSFGRKSYFGLGLKSCFLFSFSSWASLMFDVEHPFVRNIFNIP